MTSISTQPAPITSPSLTTTATLPAEISRQSQSAYHPPIKVPFRRARRAITVLGDILVFLWIGLLVVPVAILVVIGFMYGLSVTAPSLLYCLIFHQMFYGP